MNNISAETAFLFLDRAPIVEALGYDPPPGLFVVRLDSGDYFSCLEIAAKGRCSSFRSPRYCLLKIENAVLIGAEPLPRQLGLGIDLK